MHTKLLGLASLTLLTSLATAQFNFHLADLGSISHLTYHDVGSIHSLETRSLTDKYDTLLHHKTEASSPLASWNGGMFRAASEALGVSDRWLPTAGEAAQSQWNALNARDAEPGEQLQATLVQRNPTPCSHSEGLRHA